MTPMLLLAALTTSFAADSGVDVGVAGTFDPSYAPVGVNDLAGVAVQGVFGLLDAGPLRLGLTAGYDVQLSRPYRNYIYWDDEVGDGASQYFVRSATHALVVGVQPEIDVHGLFFPYLHVSVGALIGAWRATPDGDPDVEDGRVARVGAAVVGRFTAGFRFSAPRARLGWGATPSFGFEVGYQLTSAARYGDLGSATLSGVTLLGTVGVRFGKRGPKPVREPAVAPAVVDRPRDWGSTPQPAQGNLSEPDTGDAPAPAATQPTPPPEEDAPDAAPPPGDAEASPPPNAPADAGDAPQTPEG